MTVIFIVMLIKVTNSDDGGIEFYDESSFVAINSSVYDSTSFFLAYDDWNGCIFY